MVGWTEQRKRVGAGRERRHVVGLRGDAGEDLARGRRSSRWPSLISTLCGMPASWLSKSISNGASAGARQRRVWSKAMSLATIGTARHPSTPAHRTVAGGGVALGRWSILPCEPGVELGRGHRVDVEQHHPMAGPAQLGALAAEGLPGEALVDVELEDVDPARHDVALEQELRDVEGVDDVRAVEVQLHRAAGRDVQAAGSSGPDRARTRCRAGRWRRLARRRLPVVAGTRTSTGTGRRRPGSWRPGWRTRPRRC